jgi:hypothetical protein
MAYCQVCGEPYLTERPEMHQCKGEIVEAAFKPGWRVNRIGQEGISGVVLEVRDDKTHVHWGTATNVEGRPGITKTTWEPTETLEWTKHKIWAGDVETKAKALVWDPDNKP